MRQGMVWAPTKANREAIKFWLDCLQIFTVVAGVIAVASTFYFHNKEELQRDRDRLVAEENRTKEQAQRENEQLAALKRELERPYQEKKLALYLDAARVLARLATSPTLEKEKTEARFWELYWGELAFVESRSKDEVESGPPSVESLMVKFCREYFRDSSDRCSKSDVTEKLRSTPVEAAAIEMARQASQEVRDRWEKIGQ